MQKPETVFRTKLRPKLEAIPDSFWESIQQKTIIGTPDILGCVRGYFVALELKSRGGVVTVLQELKLKRIRAAGGFAFVVDPDNADSVLKKLGEIC